MTTNTSLPTSFAPNFFSAPAARVQDVPADTRARPERPDAVRSPGIPRTRSTTGQSLPGAGDLRGSRVTAQVKVAFVPVVIAGVTLSAAEVAVIAAAVTYAAWKIMQDPKQTGKALIELKRDLMAGSENVKRMAVEQWDNLVGIVNNAVETAKGNWANLGALKDNSLQQIQGLGSRQTAPQQSVQQPSAQQQQPAAQPQTRPTASVYTLNKQQAPAAPQAPPIDVNSLPIVQSQVVTAQSGYAGLRTAAGKLDTASAQLARVNDPMVKFYYAAAGGRDARTRGAPQNQLARVQAAFNELKAAVQGANAPISEAVAAAGALRQIVNSPANRSYLASDIVKATRDLSSNAAALNKQRDTLKSQIGAIEGWLHQAYQHVADGTTALPNLPATVLGGQGQTSQRVANDLAKAQQAALGALQNGAAQQQRRSQATAPTQTKTLRSTGVDPTKPRVVGYYNPSIGKTIASPQAGAAPVTAQWVNKLPVGGQRLKIDIDPNTGQVHPHGEGPADAVPVDVVREQRSDSKGNHYHFNFYWGGGPDQDPNDPKKPDWKAKVLEGLGIAGLSSLLGSVPLQLTQAHQADEAKRVLQPNFDTANNTARALINGLNPTSSGKQVKDAREAIWKNYFSAANEALEKAHWQKAFNVLGGGPIYTEADMKEIESAQNKFLDSLRNQPVPTRASGDPGIQTFNTYPTLPGDSLKTRFMNDVFERTNRAAAEQVNQIAPRLLGKDAGLAIFVPRAFDRQAYLQGHKSELGTEQGRKAAVAAVWRYYLLDQLVPAFGTRLSPAEQKAFKDAAQTWLGSENLDPNQFLPLATNDDVQKILASVKARAGQDIDWLNKNMPGAAKPESLINQVLPLPGATNTNLGHRGVVQTTPADTAVTTSTPTPDATATPESRQQRVANQATVFAQLQSVVQARRLTSAPQGTRISELRFAPEMFLPAGQPKTAVSIEAARVQALKLFNAMRELGAKNPGLNADFRDLLNMFIRDVFNPMAKLQPYNVPQPPANANPSPTQAPQFPPVETTPNATPTPQSRIRQINPSIA